MQRLPDAELDVMLALWETDEQFVPRAYFDQKLSHKNWTVNALNSFLTRLEDRGFVLSKRDGKNKYYSASIKREDYLSCEGKNILKKLYRGSIKNFLLSVTEQEGLAKDEIEELRRYLDDLRGSSNDC